MGNSGRIRLRDFKFPKGTNPTHVQTSEDAIRYCTLYCSCRELGCRVGCRLMKHFEEVVSV